MIQQLTHAQGRAWKKTTVIDREQDRPTRWIQEAVHVRKEGHPGKSRTGGNPN